MVHSGLFVIQDQSLRFNMAFIFDLVVAEYVNKFCRPTHEL